MRSSPAHFDLLCRDRLGGMEWQRDRCDPASLSHARLRRRLSLPSGTGGTNLGKNARYAGENREPLQEVIDWEGKGFIGKGVTVGGQPCSGGGTAGLAGFRFGRLVCCDAMPPWTRLGWASTAGGWGAVTVAGAVIVPDPRVREGCGRQFSGLGVRRDGKLTWPELTGLMLVTHPRTDLFSGA